MNEIALDEIIYGIKKNLLPFLKLFLSISILISCFIILQTQIKSESSFYNSTIFIKGDESLTKLPVSFWFDKDFIEEAMNKSNLQKYKSKIDKDFISKFQITIGSSTINDIFNELTDNADFDNFYKKVALDPKKLNEILNNLNTKNQSYRTISIESKDLFLTEDELSIFIENWVRVINIHLMNNLNFNSQINTIKIPNVSKELYMRDIIMLSEIVQVALEYLSIIKNNYSQFSGESIEILEIQFTIVKDALNSLIRQDGEALQYVKDGHELKIQYINKTINQINAILEGRKNSTNEEGDLISRDQFNLSGDAIKSLLNLGNQIAINESKQKYENMLFDLENDKFKAENDRRRFMNSSILISSSDLKNQVEIQLPILIKKTNTIIENIKFSGELTTNPIVLLTSPSKNDISPQDHLIGKLIIVLIASSLISISTLVILNFSRDKL